ncbi:MAG: hypothetical protein ACRCXM_15050, partial [Beijerinckiaceae bacterium]
AIWRLRRAASDIIAPGVGDLSLSSGAQGAWELWQAEDRAGHVSGIAQTRQIRRPERTPSVNAMRRLWFRQDLKKQNPALGRVLIVE